MEKRQYKKQRSCWNAEAESLLIHMWEERIDDLRGTRKNVHVYKEICEEMLAYGHVFSSEEVKIKIHNLTNKYRLEKKKVGPTGASPSIWEHYEKVHAIIGSHKCNMERECMEDNLYSSMLNIDILEESYTENSVATQNFNVSSPIIPNSDQGPSTSRNSQTRSYISDESQISSPSLAQWQSGSRKPSKRSNNSEISEILKESLEITRQEQADRQETDRKIIKLQEDILEVEKERNEVIKLMLK